MRQKFFFLFLCYTQILLSQNINFIARADAKQIALGETFDVTFALQNAELNNPQLPDFKGFTVVSKPEKGSQFSYRKGVKIIENNIFITLQAKSLGVFTIPPTQVSVNGKMYVTNALKIEVLKKSAIQKKQKTNIFLQLETNQANPYIGAPIALDLKALYNTKHFNFQQLQEPVFEGFFVQKVQNFDKNPIREIINSNQYQSQLLCRYFLFPQKTGVISIKPFSIVADTSQEQEANNTLVLSSNSLVINAKELPKNAPKAFDGAVGNFEMTTKISKNSLSTDDTLSLEVTIKGNGDVKRINAPVFHSTDSVEIYAPKIIYEYNETGYAVKTFEYVIVMKRAGKFNIEPMFTYFDTAQEKYSILKNRQIVTISQGNGLKKTEGTKNVENTNLNTFDWTALAKKALIFALLLISILLFLQRNKKIKNADNQAIIKDNNSNKVQKNDLTIAQENLKNNELNDFYKNVAKALEMQLKTFLNLEQATKPVLFEKLAQTPQADLTIEINQLFQICDAARFGGGLENTNPELILAQAQRILTKLS